MIEIPLTRGKVALIDDADLNLVAPYKWYATRSRDYSWYAIGVIRGGNGKGLVFMHRLILNVPKGITVDHRDFDGLNNRRGNLRPANDSQNNSHRHKARSFRGKRTTSRFLGVNFNSRDNYWIARIRVSGKAVHLGCFKNERDAAHAYDEAAARYHGEFATLNFK